MDSSKPVETYCTDPESFNMPLEESMNDTGAQSPEASPDEDLHSILFDQISPFKKTDNPEHLRAMLQALDSACPNVKFSAQSTETDIWQFFDSKKPMDAECAGDMLGKLKASAPHPIYMNIVQMQTLHHGLHAQEWETRLTPLVSFLVLCDHCINERDDPDSVLRREMKKALKWADLRCEIERTPNAIASTTTDKGKAISAHKEIFLPLACLGLLGLRSLNKSMWKANRKISEQGDEMLKHSGIKDLLKGVGTVQDVLAKRGYVHETIKSLEAQKRLMNEQVEETLGKLCDAVAKIIQAQSDCET